MNNAAELLRLINNLVRTGTIAAVDHDAARVRVKIGTLLTAWLPWLEARAGTTCTWSPPTVGEQVVVLAPGGDLAAAVVLMSLYQQAHPAPSSSAATFHAVMPDGAVLEYDHDAKHLQATLPGSATLAAQGAVEITAAGGATINADTVINGKLAVNGSSLTHNGKNVGHDHPHNGVVPGDGQSGGPV